MLAIALEIARRFSAHLEVLLMRRTPEHAVPYLLGSLARSTLRETIIEAAEREEDECGPSWCARTSTISVACTASRWWMGPSQANGTWTASWREGERPDLVRRARLNDLAVVSRPPDPARPDTLETLLLQSGRPVLLVPPVVGETVATRIAIGWNDSTEGAARAVAAALPFLNAAESVTILASAKRGESARDLADYLGWHRVAATVRSFEPSGALRRSHLARRGKATRRRFVCRRRIQPYSGP